MRYVEESVNSEAAGGGFNKGVTTGLKMNIVNLRLLQVREALARASLEHFLGANARTLCHVTQVGKCAGDCGDNPGLVLAPPDQLNVFEVTVHAKCHHSPKPMCPRSFVCNKEALFASSPSSGHGRQHA